VGGKEKGGWSNLWRSRCFCVPSSICKNEIKSKRGKKEKKSKVLPPSSSKQSLSQVGPLVVRKKKKAKKKKREKFPETVSESLHFLWCRTKKEDLRGKEGRRKARMLVRHLPFQLWKGKDFPRRGKEKRKGGPLRYYQGPNLYSYFFCLRSED